LKQSDPDLSEIEPYIMAVQASEKGVFAHPPEGKNIPLADVEYGYHFLPGVWCKFVTSHLVKTTINWIKADIGTIEQSENEIHSISLSNGEKIKADFIIDALGAASKLKIADAQFQSSGRTVKAIGSFDEMKPLQGVCRVLSGTEYGWQAETPLQNGLHRLTVFDPESEDEAMEAHGAASTSPDTAELGRVETPWVGNCLTLGHGAAILEPLSPAPILLLQNDIDRLAELIPVTTDMKIESREYNRRFQSDYEHADLFSRAFFTSTKNAETPYWRAAIKVPTPDKLRDKILQFNSRGVHVQYDYEPFSTQDWAMQHFGMGRCPERYDPLADHIPGDQLKQRLLQMKTAVNMMAKKMPPHPVYMSGLLKYLKDKHG
jgi:tryptophan halogenase